MPAFLKFAKKLKNRPPYNLLNPLFATPSDPSFITLTLNLQPLNVMCVKFIDPYCFGFKHSILAPNEQATTVSPQTFYFQLQN